MYEWLYDLLLTHFCPPLYVADLESIKFSKMSQ